LVVLALDRRQALIASRRSGLADPFGAVNLEEGPGFAVGDRAVSRYDALSPDESGPTAVPTWEKGLE